MRSTVIGRDIGRFGPTRRIFRAKAAGGVEEAGRNGSENIHDPAGYTDDREGAGTTSARNLKRTVKSILIIEDQIILSDLLSRVIEDKPCFRLVGRTDDGQEGVRLFEKTEPDIVVLDVGLPRLSGLEILRRIKKIRPKTFVVIFTARTEKRVIQEALKSGTDSFLEKNIGLEELEKALEFAYAGQPYFCPQVMAMVRGLLNEPQAGSRIDGLSPREREILQLIAEGHTTKEIGGILCLSIGTVNTHRWNLMRKLNIHDAATLTRFAIEEGLTEVNLAR